MQAELLEIDAEVLRKLSFQMGAQSVAVMHNVDEPMMLYSRNGKPASLRAKAGTFVVIRFPGSDGDTVEQVENVE